MCPCSKYPGLLKPPRRLVRVLNKNVYFSASTYACMAISGLNVPYKRTSSPCGCRALERRRAVSVATAEARRFDAVHCAHWSSSYRDSVAELCVGRKWVIGASGGTFRLPSSKRAARTARYCWEPPIACPSTGARKISLSCIRVDLSPPPG